MRYLVALSALLVTFLVPPSPAAAQEPLSLDQFFQMVSSLATGGQTYAGGFTNIVDGSTTEPGVSAITFIATQRFGVSPTAVVDFAERSDLPANITAHPADRGYGAEFNDGHAFLVRLTGPLATGPTMYQESGLQFFDPNGAQLVRDPAFPFHVLADSSSLTALVRSPAQSGSILGTTNTAGGLNISLNGYTFIEINAPNHTDLFIFGPLSAPWAAYNVGSDDFSPTDPSSFERVGAQITDRQPPADEVTELAILDPATSQDRAFLDELADFYAFVGVPVPEDLRTALENGASPGTVDGTGEAAAPAPDNTPPADPVADGADTRSEDPPPVADRAVEESGSGDSSGGPPGWLLGIIGVTVLAAVTAAVKFGPLAKRVGPKLMGDLADRSEIVGLLTDREEILHRANRLGLPEVDGMQKIDWQDGTDWSTGSSGGQTRLGWSGLDGQSGETITKPELPKFFLDVPAERRPKYFAFWMNPQTGEIRLAGHDSPEPLGVGLTPPEVADEPDDDGWDFNDPKPMNMDGEMPAS